MTPYERLEEIAKEEKRTPRQIVAIAGPNPSIVSPIRTGKKALSEDLAQAIEKAWGYRKEWILTGELPKVKERVPVALYGGNYEAEPISMVDETDVTTTEAGSEFRDLDNGKVLLTIPLVDEYAYASYPHGWKDPEYIEDLPKHSIVLDKRDKCRYRAFTVRGDSMDNGSRKAICSGDIVIGKFVEPDAWNKKLYVNGGKDYVIVHQDGVFIKRIVYSNTEEGIINCISTNPDKLIHPDFPVNLSEVYELYLIAKVERNWKD